MTGDGDERDNERDETADITGDEGKDDGIGGSKLGERGGESVRTKVSEVSRLVDNLDFRDLALMLGWKVSGRLDFDPYAGAKLPRWDDNVSCIHFTDSPNMKKDVYTWRYR